jgi:ferredoxin
MSMIIVEACISCGACEPECPNTAIYQGGVEWEINGVKHPAIATDTFYIVREKCTECVGFFDHEACAAVCPVDCCIADTKSPETEEVLLARAGQLHVDKAFGDAAPSRFRKGSAATPTAPPEVKASGAAAPPAPAAETVEIPPPPPPPLKAAAAAAPPPAPRAQEPAKTAPPPAKAPPAETTAEPSAAAQSASSTDTSGLAEWDIPIECFRCGRTYGISYKYFRSGVVLYCPACHGSYVVTTTLYGYVSPAVREFHARWREQFDRVQAERPKDLKEFEEQQRLQLERFNESLKKASREIRAPGAPRKRAWIFG